MAIGQPRKFDDKQKWCARCKQYLPLDCFGNKKSSKSPSGKQGYCKPCHRKTTAKYTKKYALMSLYGITQEQANKMWRDQNGICKICSQSISEPQSGVGLGKSTVDHCHRTSKVRGLLCSNCNRGLGYFSDNPNFLLSAAKYIRDNDPEYYPI